MTESENSNLRRIESSLREVLSGNGAILAEMQGFRREIDEEKTIRKDHSEHNRVDFQRILDLFEAERAANDKRFDDQTKDRQMHLGEQDVKIDAIKATVDILSGDISMAKGAGWAVVGLLGTGFLYVVSVIVDYIRIHFKFG
jgi:hypothetical protein